MLYVVGDISISLSNRYVRILINSDKTFTQKHNKMTKTYLVSKGHVKQKRKVPAALVSVANMVGVTNIDQIFTNIDKYCIINYYWISHLLQLIKSNFAYLSFLLFNGGFPYLLGAHLLHSQRGCSTFSSLHLPGNGFLTALILMTRPLASQEGTITIQP